MRITAEGQVTIPEDIREFTGLLPGTEVEFIIDGATVRLAPAGKGPQARTRGQQIVDSLVGAGDYKMSTDEIVELMRGPPAEV